MRALKSVVIGMGVLIVVGVGLVAYGLVSRVPMGERSDRGFSDRGFGAVDLALPAGCAIAEATAEGGRLVVRADGPGERGCQQVVVIDLASGKILGRVHATPRP